MPNRLLVAISLVFATTSLAATDPSWLLLPGAGPGGAGYSGTARPAPSGSLQLNPAGLAGIDRGDFSFSQIFLIADTRFSSFSASLPVSFGAFNLGYDILSSAPVDESLGGVATGGILRFASSSLRMTFGRRLFPGHGFGASIRYLDRQVIGHSESGFSMDLGWIWSVTDRAFSRWTYPADISFGLSLRQAGMIFGGATQTPLSLSAGLSGTLFRGGVLAMDASWFPNEKNIEFRTGLEYSPFDFLVVRAGGELSDEPLFDAGAGLRFRIADMKLNLDYCLRPFNADRRDHQVSLLMTYDILRRPPVTNTRTVTNREMIERIVTNRETVERTVTNHSGPVRAAAALDFRNLSGRNDLDHLGTAIPEALASWLNEHCGLAVIDRSTAMKKAGSETAFTLESVPTGERQALAERIGASCVISGSFTEVDNEIQISASLTDLTTGEVKTTVTRRGTMGRDIFTVLDGLAEELCGKINRLNETTGSP